MYTNVEFEHTRNFRPTAEMETARPGSEIKQSGENMFSSTQKGIPLSRVKPLSKEVNIKIT